MTGHSECIYPDNGVEYGIHPSPRQGSNPRFLYKVVGPVNFRWSNWVVNCKLVLIVNLTGTAVRKTISHIFQPCSFCLCRTLSRYGVLDVAWYTTRKMGESDACKRRFACSGFCVPRRFVFDKTGIRELLLSAIQWRDGWTHAVVSCCLLE
jgi:hypothetical protein